MAFLPGLLSLIGGAPKILSTVGGLARDIFGGLSSGRGIGETLLNAGKNAIGNIAGSFLGGPSEEVVSQHILPQVDNQVTNRLPVIIPPQIKPSLSRFPSADTQIAEQSPAGLPSSRVLVNKNNLDEERYPESQGMNTPAGKDRAAYEEYRSRKKAKKARDRAAYEEYRYRKKAKKPAKKSTKKSKRRR